MQGPLYRVRSLVIALLAALLLGGTALAQLSPQEAAAQYDIDLSGIEITTTSSILGPLLVPSSYMFQMLEAWGADIEIVTLTTTSGVQALIANRSDLAPHGADELIIGAAEGADLVAYGSPQSRINYVLIGAGDVTTVADLEGATVGMSGPAGFDTLLTRFSLRDAGLDPDSSTRFVQIGGSGERAAALLAGRVDAATIGLDDWFELRNRSDNVQVVQYMSEVVPDFATELYFSKRAFLEANPQVGLAVACGNLEANRWANDYPDAFVEYTLANVTGATEDATRDLYDVAIEVNMWPTTPEGILSEDGLDGLMEAMLETGDISNPVDVANYLDISYLEDAFALGCGN